MEGNYFHKSRAARLITYVFSLVLISALSSAITLLVVTRSGYAGVFQAAQIIRERYYFYEDKFSDETVLPEAAIKGMVASLDDPYATYYTKSEYENHTASISGKYKGLGIVISFNEAGECHITKVYSGSTGDNAGLLQGDIITEINGTEVSAGLSTGEINGFLFDEGDNEIVVLRGGEQLYFSVMKGPVTVPYSSFELIEPDIGYLVISEFHGNVASEVREFLLDCNERQVKKLIIDLRDDPGGAQDSVLQIADYFLEKGLVITSFDSKRDGEKFYYSKSGFIYQGEIILLVNGNTASAAELLTGCLKDHEIARVIGTQTYGKGIAQTTYSINKDNGYVKLTTAAYYTPSHVCIHGVGITPDIIVEQSEKYQGVSAELIPHEEDLQLQRALTELKGE